MEEVEGLDFAFVGSRIRHNLATHRNSTHPKPNRCILKDVKTRAASVFLLLVFTAFVSAQSEKAADCPALSIAGSDGISLPGDTVQFKAYADTRGKPIKLEYRWEARSIYGNIEITKGQGTPSATFIWPKGSDTLTVEVEVRGLPQGCPNRAAESTVVDFAPPAEKLYQFRAGVGKADQDKLRKIASAMIKDPNSQLYIISSSPKNANNRLESEITDFLVSQGLAKDHITITPVDSSVSVFQFWRVPPGAENPKCDECKEPVAQSQCPTITVAGPSGPTEPGHPYVFSAHVSGKVPKDIRYVWTTSMGQMREGQGTTHIEVYYVGRESGNLMATLKVIGLPKECPNSASETAPFIDEPLAVLIDDFISTNSKSHQFRLKNAVDELRNNPNDLLVIIEYYKKGTSAFTVRERVRRISEYLTKQLKLNGRAFKTITSEIDKDRTRVFRVPPGAENPTP